MKEIKPFDLSKIRKVKDLPALRKYLFQFKKYFKRQVSSIRGETVGFWIRRSLADIESAEETLPPTSSITVYYEMGYYNPVIITPHQIHNDNRISSINGVRILNQKVCGRVEESLSELFAGRPEFLNKAKISAKKHGYICVLQMAQYSPDNISCFRVSVLLDLKPLIKGTGDPAIYLQGTYECDGGENAVGNGQKHSFTQPLEAWQNFPREIGTFVAHGYSYLIDLYRKKKFLEKEVMKALGRKKIPLEILE